MRTTVTLDPDVAARVRAVVVQSNRSMKDVLNSALRKGLRDETGRQRRARFKVRAFDMGSPRFDINKANQFLDDLEISDYSRKAGRR